MDTLEVKTFSEKRDFKYVCIEGNIGSGKSTIARELAKKLKADYLPELFENNYFLPLFYANPKPYAFHLEYSFFISRVQQLSDYFKSPGKTLICDFSLYKSLWFAKINLSKTEYSFYKKQVEAILQQLPKPDLIIYLDTSLKNLKQNIAKRARPYEKNISAAYLQSIADEYRAGLDKLPKTKKNSLQIKKYDAKTQGLITDIIVKQLREIF